LNFRVRMLVIGAVNQKLLKLRKGLFKILVPNITVLV